MHVFWKYLYHKWIGSPHKWYPILSVYYLTNACDFRCPYCSDGSGTPYYKLPAETLPGSSAISLLKIIRRHSDYVVITGGEPLNHPDFKYVMEHLDTVKFKNVVLTTNGYEIDSYLPSIASSVRSLVFSIDTLDCEKADAWYGVGRGVLKKILRNIEQAAKQKGKKYDIIISSVVTPDNIDDLYDVYRYARECGFMFAAAPQLMGVKAHKSLTGSSRYRELYDFLITEKKRGGKIFGTILYLEYMKDLKKFTCHPFTMLVVSPLGDVFYPCLEVGHFAENLLEESNLHRIRQKGLQRFGPQPNCDNRCHSACALGFALALHYPSSLLYEGYLMAIQSWYNYKDFL